MKKIFISLPRFMQDEFLPEEVLKPFISIAEIGQNMTDEPLSEDALSSQISDVDGVITGWTDKGLSENNIRMAKNLKIIGVIGGLVAKVSPDVAMERGIIIVNAARTVCRSVAEYVIGTMIMALRNIGEFDGGMKSGKLYDYNRTWSEARTLNLDIGEDLECQEIGLIGFGPVAERLVELLRPFNCIIRVFSSHLTDDEAGRFGVKLCSLDEILQKSKIVSLHCALNDKTREIIGHRELNLMKPGAILINTARGPLVDEEALIETLKSGRIGAVLDEFYNEPLALESPLRKLNDVILTPHIAGHTRSCHLSIGRQMVRDFMTFFDGKIPANALSKKRVRTMS